MKVSAVIVICHILSVSTAMVIKRNSEPLLLSSFDWNRNGVLDHRELRIIKRILSAIFDTPRPAIRQLMRIADADRDGTLSEQEFDTLISSNFNK